RGGGPASRPPRYSSNQNATTTNWCCGPSANVGCPTPSGAMRKEASACGEADQAPAAPPTEVTVTALTAVPGKRTSKTSRTRRTCTAFPEQVKFALNTFGLLVNVSARFWMPCVGSPETYANALTAPFAHRGCAT